MRRGRFLLAAVWAAGMMAASTGGAHALSCAMGDPFAGDVFFEGTIRDVRVDKPLRALVQEQTDCTVHYQVEVTKVWHGVSVGDRVEIAQRIWLCLGGDHHQKQQGTSHAFALHSGSGTPYPVGLCESPFFDPYQGDALKPAFQARLDQLNQKP